MNYRYSVMVSNIGTVYEGDDKEEAHETFNTYKDLSIRNVGRSAGESVILFMDGEILREYVGTIEAPE